METIFKYYAAMVTVINTNWVVNMIVDLWIWLMLCMGAAKLSGMIDKGWLGTILYLAFLTISYVVLRAITLPQNILTKAK